jgi:ABC-type sugar transport system substrate-binding protein
VTRRIQSKFNITLMITILLLITTGCTAVKVQQVNTRDESIKPSIIEENDANPSPFVPGRKLVIGFSQLGAESDWRKANTISIQEAAAEAGIELRFTDAEQKQSSQIEAIRQFIADKVDVIAFSPVVQSGWEPILREAKQAGIPVIITDRTVDVTDPSLYVTFMGSDFYEEGRRAGKYLLDKMKNVKGPVNIVELQGTVGSSPSIDRKKGFEEIIKTNPNLKMIKSQSGDFTFEQGKQVMESFLKDEGNHIQALYAHNDDMALGAIEAIEQYGLKPGKDIIIISVDGTRKALRAMIEDKINCIVECNPLLGPPLMQAVKELIAGKILPKRIVTKDDIFTKDNAEREIINRKY